MKTNLNECTFRCPCVNAEGEGCGENVTVGVFYYPAERMTWDYPGMPASSEVNEWPATCDKGCVFSDADIDDLVRQYNTNEFSWPCGGYDD